jgi:hypothetical protein
MPRAQAPTLPVPLFFDKKCAVGALNGNSLKKFRDASPEDATGTSRSCSDLHSPDSSSGGVLTMVCIFKRLRTY